MRNFIYILIFLLPCSLFAQQGNEIGFPLIKDYTPKDYDGSNQNWAIIQGKTGIMYFGNIGVLQYDGFDWRRTSLPNNSVARSLAIDENGRIYVGGVGDFGYLQADSIGKTRFISLLKYVPEEYKKISDVWNAFIDGENVFFTTDTYVFCWTPKSQKMKVWKASNSFHQSFLVNGRFYIREWGKGLLELEGDSLKLVPGGAEFADERIYAMLAMPDNPKNILVVTRTKGLFLFDGNSFTPFKTEADEFIKKNLIYLPGLVLNDGNIALGTLTGGLVIINSKGEILNIYNTNTGLPSNTIYYLYQDNAGSIWVGQENGISKIAYGSSATYFDDRNGITETPYDLKRYDGKLYLSTNSGIYYLDTKTSSFQHLENSPVTQCFVLSLFNGHLAAGTNEGLYEIRNNKVVHVRKSVNKDFEVAVLLPSKYKSNRLYVGTKEVSSFLMKNGKWVDQGTIFKVGGYVVNIVETAEGNLWFGNTVNGINRIIFKKDSTGKININDPKVEFFDEKSGLPGGQCWISKVLNEYFFTTQGGTYRFNESRKQFFRDDSTFSFVHLKSYTDVNLSAFEDSFGRVWAWGGAEPSLGIPQKDGSYNWITAPFKRFSNESILNIYPDKNNIVWFLTGDGLIRYNMDLKISESKEYDALISTVTVDGDSIIYFGGLLSQSFIPEISFGNNSVKFRYAAASYEDEQANKFKLYLDGFDKGWSGWNSEHFKEYTNLSPGEYIFKVKAKNSANVESKEASFSFIVLAPWYRTWWAYAFYALCLGLLFIGIDRFQKRKVIKKEREQSQLRETELRAEAAEEKKKNIELLSEIGRNITANLSIEQIIDTVYENVNSLMDASVFGIGVYNSEFNRLDFPATREKGVKLPAFSNLLTDENRPAVWCFNNQKEILSNDYEKDYKKYIKVRKETAAGDSTESLIYLPLTYKGKKIGVITAQSFKKNAYTDYHLNILRNLATYTAIAIDNADAYKQLNSAINDLKSTQEKLIVQQKLASLGQLTAGIAHEIKNPLNFVNNFAEVSVELVGELKEEITKFKDMVSDSSAENMMEIIRDLEENSQRINQHGKRADSIVKSMLQHSRGKSGERFEADINAIIDEDINLAYHGMRARDTSFNVTIEKDFDRNLEKVSVVPQDVSRVFLNIINNGFYETGKKQKMLNNSFSPILRVSTYDFADKIEVHIRDNGNGIPADVRDKLFEPFFTTKPSGEGTGLGLSLSHDIIVKQHSGEIKFKTEEGEFTEFIVTLPK